MIVLPALSNQKPKTIIPLRIIRHSRLSAQKSKASFIKNEAYGLYIKPCLVIQGFYLMTTRSLYTKQQSNDVVATIFDAFDNGSITLHMKQALINLFQILKSGNNSPTQRHVANKARISLRTVSEAIRVAKALGLVLVVPQYEIVKGRPRRLANRYFFNALK
ncbi:hypothetical protein B0W47_17555 (plasmid) [Komagataeibacter nataicola]|uniref:Uncharacterized protein n=2 Tax=Komagataeibacter nataicola TaxID=265960 RepID=A0A9N7CU10_9PROT|nr:hypothetical protein B0W47_17555 [Komagataeibacter nataicola]